MQISFNGIEMLKQFEGFRAKAYRCSAGVWTIGYGTIKIDGKPVEEGMVTTEAQAKDYLRQDLAWAQTAVNKLVKVPLKQNQFDALVSFIYNIGEGAFAKSTMLRLLNAGDYSGAATQFDRWTRAGGKIVRGLVSRRKVERGVFES